MNKITAIFRCRVDFADGGAGLMHGIGHDGKLWLVPSWLGAPGGTTVVPLRLIRFDNLEYLTSSEPGCAYEGVQLPINAADLYAPLPAPLEYSDLTQNLCAPRHMIAEGAGADMTLALAAT